MLTIKKNTWYVLGNDLQTRFRGMGKAGWESKDLPLPFQFTYLIDGQCIESGLLFSVDHERTEDDLKAMIGKQVVKCSGDGRRASKPFKSGVKQNTVKGLVKSPNTGKISFTFIEDDSYVECDRCYLAFIEENMSTLMQMRMCPDTPKGFNTSMDIMASKYPHDADLFKTIRDGFNAIMEP